MPRQRSFRGRGVSQSQRRKKSWFALKLVISTGIQVPGYDTMFQLETVADSTVGRSVRDGFIAMSGDGTAIAPFTSTIPEESTILRVRGSLVFPKYDTSAATGTDHSFGFGVSAISDLNSDSYPGPLSDIDSDTWMFLRKGAIAPLDAAGTIVDVKAMRKVVSGDAFFVMAETTTSSSNPTDGLWQFDLRLLILLP